jgi:hypothetical protein
MPSWPRCRIPRGSTPPSAARAIAIPASPAWCSSDTNARRATPSQAACASGGTSNDLIRYAQRWVERAPDTAGVHVGRNVEESIRFRFAMPGVDEVFYEFVSDDRVVVMTGVQAKAERERLRAAEMEGKMVNF